MLFKIAHGGVYVQIVRDVYGDIYKLPFLRGEYRA